MNNSASLTDSISFYHLNKLSYSLLNIFISIYRSDISHLGSSNGNETFISRPIITKFWSDMIVALVKKMCLLLVDFQILDSFSITSLLFALRITFLWLK